MSNGIETLLNWIREHDDVVVELSWRGEDIQIAMNHCGCYRFKYIDSSYIPTDQLIDILDIAYSQIYEEVKK